MRPLPLSRLQREKLASTASPVVSGNAVLWGAIVIVLTVWALGALSILLDRRARIHSAEVEQATLTRAYAEHIGKTLESADQALRFIRSEHRRLGSALDIKAYLNDGDIIGTDFHQLGVIGADGFLTHSSVAFSRVDLREREHFRVHVNSKEDQLFVSKPVLGKASGKWSIQLTRRIQTASGEFGGVAVLSMPPTYFGKYFERTNSGDNVLTGLTGLDGVIRVRTPDPDGKGMGADVRERPLFKEMVARGSGVTRQVGGVDKVERIFAFQTLAPYKLVVYSGKAVDDVLAPWYARTAGTVLALTLLTLCIASLGANLLRRARSQQQLMQSLQASTLQLRGVVSTMMAGSTAVAGAGSTMSVAAQTLAIRTDQQGEQLDTTAQAVREAVGQVSSTAEHVSRVDERCAALREQTRSGTVVVARGVAAIEGIASRTREMGDAVSMIEAIAFQTNILALNAAVEAARAGEAGRAFAIVAGEVRELASRSRGSAGQVRELIARATEQAAVGVREATAVREVLEGISGGVEAVADDMRAVAAESHSQSELLQRVTRGLDDLSQITRSNADMVAESVMAAEEMREHAVRLRTVVSEIEQDVNPAAPVAAANGQTTPFAEASTADQPASPTPQVQPTAKKNSAATRAEPAESTEGVQFF